MENLRAATVTIWNAGREPIRQADVATGATLSASLPEGNTLLSASIERAPNPLNKFEIKSISPSEVLLDFEFFAKHEGVILKLLYAGNAEAPTIRGHIIGAGDIRPALMSTKLRDMAKVLGLVAIPVGIIGWLFLILPLLDRWDNPSLAAGMAKFGIAVIGMNLVAIGLFALVFWMDQPAERVPAALASS